MKIETIRYKFFNGKGGINICFGEEKEFIELIKKRYNVQLTEDRIKGWFYRPGDEYIKTDKGFHNYIYLKELKTLDDLDTLTHEIQHFVIRELHYRGIYVLYKDDEIYDEEIAYFSGYIYSLILNKLYKLKLK